jgi:hypothetical protein
MIGDVAHAFAVDPNGTRSAQALQELFAGPSWHGRMLTIFFQPVD